MVTLVLIREPLGIALRRIAGRAFVPAVAVAAWMFELAAWATWVVTIAAVPSAALLVFAVLNVAKNRLMVLVRDPSGALVWPRSVQEVLLGRPTDTVRGDVITVVKEPPVMLNRMEPRISLYGDGTSILRVPLYGADVDDAVAGFNEELAGSGTQLVIAEPETLPDDASEGPPADPSLGPAS